MGLGRWWPTPSTGRIGGSSVRWRGWGSVYVLGSRSRTLGGTRGATIGALWEAALAAGWEAAGGAGGMEEGGAPFCDGHREGWWALEVEAGPYGKRRAKRALVVTPDPERLPDLATWYLTTNLPAPGVPPIRKSRGRSRSRRASRRW